MNGGGSCELIAKLRWERTIALQNTAFMVEALISNWVDHGEDGHGREPFFTSV